MNIFKYIRNRWHNDINCKISEQVHSVSLKYNKLESDYSQSIAEINELKQSISLTYDELVRLRDGIIKTTPRKSIKLCFDIIEECNLNCAYCLVFSPCAQKIKAYTMSIERFESDIKRISELFLESEIEVISLSGGEPLLHKDINKFPQVIRKYFSNVNIRIVTNGILLPNEPEEFWNNCKNYDVTIEQTKYPIPLHFEDIKKKSDSYGVRHIFMGDTDKNVKTMQKFPLNVQAVSEDTVIEQNERLNFFNCWEANTCIRLQEGRLYTCSRIPHVQLFNDCFNTELPISEDDSIDIYKAQSKKEIYEFLAAPVPFCRYCKVSKISGNHYWKQSEVKISEWS